MSYCCTLISRRWNSYITTPIYYVNAAPHLGHLYTTVLADAAHRWEVMKSPAEKHIFSTGTDEHGIKVLRSAQAVGKEPQVFCDDVSNVFRGLFKEFDIQNSTYIRTTESRHKEAVQHIWNILQNKGLIYKSIYKGWYCPIDECFYQDKDVESKETYKVVKGTNNKVEWVEEDNYMFKLSEFKGEVKKWLTTNDVVRPKHYLPMILKLMENDEDLSISRCQKRQPWGIPVPNDSTQTIYVWLDALVNYLSVCGYPNDIETMSNIWPPSCQILGKDIMKFHAIYWPAFLLGAGLPLPKRLFIHGHWLVDNVKMSKSLGNVVEPFGAANRFTQEGIRYFLLKQGVPQDDSNFTDLKALQVINSDLINNFGNLLSRSTVKKLNPDQKYPYLTPDLLQETPLKIAEPLIASLNDIRDSTTDNYNGMLFYKAIENIMAVVKQGNAFFQAAEPWKMTQGEELCTVLHVCYEAIRVSSILLQPIIPHSSAHALNRLGVAAEKRSLDNAIFGGQSDIFGTSLGADRGPFMSRLE